MTTWVSHCSIRELLSTLNQSKTDFGSVDYIYIHPEPSSVSMNMSLGVGFFMSMVWVHVSMLTSSQCKIVFSAD